MSKFDVVIVGSGFGGLVCGYMLSKEGYKVCILEKNHQLGGCLQTFVRNGCIFDTGMHYVGSLEPGQILYRFFKYLGLMDKIKLKKLDEDAFDIISVAGTDYKYAQGYDNFINTLLQSFPDEKEALIKYTDKLKEIANSLSLYNLKEVETYHNLIDNEYITVGAFDYIKSITSNERLQNVLSGLNSLYGGEKDKTPLYPHAIIKNSLIDSAWRLVDGGDQIAKLLADSIIENGGSIFKKQEVTKFVLDSDNRNIKYAELSDSEQIEGKYFISDIHPVKTLEMIDGGLIRKSYRNRINSLDNTIPIFSIYIVFKENTFNYLNYNIYHYNDENVWGTETYQDNATYIKNKWPDGYMCYTPANSKSDVYADCMIAMTYLKFNEVKNWEHTTIEKRGEDYLELKEYFAQKFINELDKRFPGIRGKIKAYYTSTPLTYRDYIGTVNGSPYGIIKDFNNPLNSFLRSRTRIPNLLLTGQNIGLHGIIGVSIGSLLTCSELLDLNYLIRKINDAS
ncbi:phytoene desaturase family protein [Bacteroidota bacterium]